MYNLPYFKDKEQEKVLQFIHEHPFAFIIGCDENNNPVATQIPVFIEARDEKLFLSGHIMRQTDHHKAFEKNPSVLCIFTGPHTYVSATWYKNAQQASTWNYMSVHVKGQLTFLDEQGLIQVLKKTTLHFEKGDKASSTVFDNLPTDYRDRLMKAIVAFEIEVKSIDHVFKLSQNRDEESYHSIINELEQQDGSAKEVAEQMKARAATLFPDQPS
jgi:transcriptional regulator